MISTPQMTYAKCVALKAMDNGDANIREINGFLDQEIETDQKEVLNKAKDIAKDIGKSLCNKVGGAFLNKFATGVVSDPSSENLSQMGTDQIQSKLGAISDFSDIDGNISEFTKEGAGVSTLIGSSFNSVKSRINDLVNNNIGLPIDMDPKEFQNQINSINGSKLQQSFGENFNNNRISNSIKEQKENVMQQFSSSLSSLSFLRRGGITFGGTKTRILQGTCDAAFNNGLKSASTDSLMSSLTQYANLKENALNYLCNEILNKVPFGDTFANLIQGNSLVDEIKADIMYFSLVQKLELKGLIQPLL